MVWAFISQCIETIPLTLVCYLPSNSYFVDQCSHLQITWHWSPFAHQMGKILLWALIDFTRTPWAFRLNLFDICKILFAPNGNNLIRDRDAHVCCPMFLFVKKGTAAVYWSNTHVCHITHRIYLLRCYVGWLAVLCCVVPLHMCTARIRPLQPHALVAVGTKGWWWRFVCVAHACRWWSSIEDNAHKRLRQQYQNKLSLRHIHADQTITTIYFTFTSTPPKFYWSLCLRTKLYTDRLFLWPNLFNSSSDLSVPSTLN